MAKKKQVAKATRIRVSQLIPEVRQIRNEVKFSVDNYGEQHAKLRAENTFDWCLNKDIIDDEQKKAADDYYFAWYHGVIKLYGGNTTASYDAAPSGGGGGENITDFQLNCSDAHHNYGSMLDLESRQLLNAVCEGYKPIEHIPHPRFYANERLRKALDIIAIHKGYKKRR